MLNVNQITSTLSRLSDQGLQQYAAMHKDDPYTVSLAVAESNRRKQMRSEQQGMMAGQPQPKVVDQDIAQMAPPPAQMAPPMQQALPEQQGIGALPAPNMQHMADGGIAGYDDGGMAEGGGPASELEYNNEPVMRMADGGVARYSGDAESFVRTTSGGKDWFLDPPDTVRDPNVDWYREVPNPVYDATKGKKYATRDEAVAAYNRANAVPLRPHTPASQMGYDVPAPATPATTGRTTANTTAGRTGANPSVRASSGAAPAAGADDVGIANLMKQLTPMSLEERAASAKKLAAEANADSDAAYKKYADQFQAEREELAGRKNQNIGRAMMEAGFGMMESDSPYAAVGIGRGARKGMAALNEAEKSDDAAKRALMQSEMTLMQAQRAERSGNHRDAVALMNQHRQEQQAAVQLGLQAQQIKQTGAYQMGSLQVQREHNQMMKEHYANLGGKNTSLPVLKAQMQTIDQELKANPALQYTDKTRYDELTQQRDAIRATLASLPGAATMGASGAPTGTGANGASGGFGEMTIK